MRVRSKIGTERLHHQSIKMGDRYQAGSEYLGSKRRTKNNLVQGVLRSSSANFLS